MTNVGNAAFRMMYPVLAAFIAYSIADRPGFMPGLMGGYLAQTGMTTATKLSWIPSGFWGGLIAGFAAGLVLSCGCSTGGLDILGLYLSKRNPKFTVGRFCICFNVCLYTLCLLLFNAATAIYSAIYNILSNLFLDRLHQQNVNVELLIFTKKNDPELPHFIMDKLDRGVTYWTAHGAYTGDEVQVLCVCLSKYEVGTLQQVMQEIDPKAFFIVQEGIRTGGNYRRHLN